MIEALLLSLLLQAVPNAQPVRPSPVPQESGPTVDNLKVDFAECSATLIEKQKYVTTLSNKIVEQDKQIEQLRRQIEDLQSRLPVQTAPRKP